MVGLVIQGENVYTGIPVTNKLMMVLWCLANREAYRVLSRRFGLNRGNVHYIVMKTQLLRFQTYLTDGQQENNILIYLRGLLFLTLWVNISILFGSNYIFFLIMYRGN
jgi:hypothetical protein